MALPTINKSININDNLKLDIRCRDEGGEYLDTRIQINGDTLCWVSYPELDDFVKELQAVISKYRI